MFLIRRCPVKPAVPGGILLCAFNATLVVNCYDPPCVNFASKAIFACEN